MKKNMFKKILKKIKNFYNIKTINGYRKAKREKKLKELEVIRDELTGLELNISNKKLELSLRQFLLRYLVSFRFNIAIFHAINDDRPIIYPLPKEWILLLRKKGFRVNFLLSSILLYILSIFFFLKSFKTFFNYLIYFNDNFPKSEYVYFHNIPEYCLPIDNENSYDVFSWYNKKYIKEKLIKPDIFVKFNFKKNEYTKNFKIKYSKYPYPSLTSFNKLIFIINYFLLFFKIVINIFLFNYKKIILTDERVHEIYVKRLEKKNLAYEYLFNIGDFIYRPLWTYEIENFSKITLYNYSGSFLGHKRLGTYPPDEVGLKSINWPNILQWSEKYNIFLEERVNQKLNLKLVSPIWLHDKKIYLNLKNNKKTISVFDVPPSSILRKCELNANLYRTTNCSKKFLNDIVKFSKEFNIDIYFKNKRKLDNRYTSKSYQIFLEKLVSQDLINFIDPITSPFRLIEETDMNISIPFTSTSLVGKYLNKPSCFYDPMIILDKQDRATQGVDLLKGEEELKNWFKDNA